MFTIRRMLPVAAALSLVVASCGGSSDAETGDSVAPTTEAEAAGDVFSEGVVTDEPAGGGSGDEETDEIVAGDEGPGGEEATPEEPPADEVVDEPVELPVQEPDDPVADPAADAVSVEVSMSEWGFDAPTEYQPGDITFTATNNGSFPHEFVVIEGEGYEALPLAEGGSIIEDDLPTGALLGRTGRVGGGSSEDLAVTLAPGNYVLVCNLGGGATSHAGKGQRLDITVT